MFAIDNRQQSPLKNGFHALENLNSLLNLLNDNKTKTKKNKTVADTTLPNPFLSDPVGPQAGDLKSSSGINRKAVPPMRPPPPSSAAVGHASQPIAANPSTTKSPFDDLNDTIRMALINSPAKQVTNDQTAAGVSSAFNHSPQNHQTPFMQPQTVVVGAQNYGTNQQVFSSPSKQQFQGLL